MIEFIRDLLNKELTRSLTDAYRMKVCFSFTPFIDHDLYRFRGIGMFTLFGG